MMPNANNLALSLGTEMVKTDTKASKNSGEGKEEFLNFLGKTKKEEKKKSIGELGINLAQFKIVNNSLNTKVLAKTGKVEEAQSTKGGNTKVVTLGNTKGTQNLDLLKEINKSKSDKNPFVKEVGKETNSEKTLPHVSGEKKIAKNLETINTEMVLGKRIESMKSVNLKLEKVEGSKKVDMTKEKSSEKIQSLNGKIVEIPEKSGEKTLNVSEVQNKGRNANVFTKGNPLNKLETQAKNDQNFVVSETKKTELNVPIFSSYGLKKINEGLKLEEKVEGIKELQGIGKTVLEEKVEEKRESSQIIQNFKNMNFERVEVKNLNKLPETNDFNNIMKQVENGIKINYNNQLKEMKIKLQPEELGEVEVKMTIENNIMKAEFVVENQTVKEILEAKFDTLRNALENKGFSGAEINVSVSTGDNKKPQNSFVFNEEKKEKLEAQDYNSKIENLESNSKTNRISSRSGIDIMV